MKTVLTSLILLGVAALNAIAQDTSRWGLPEGAKARLGRGYINEVKYSPDGRHLAVAGGSGIWLYDSVTSDPVALMRSGNSFGAIDVVYSRDGSAFAAGADDIVCVWDAVTGEQKYSHRLTGHFAQFRFGSLALSPDGSQLAVSILNTVRLWDVETGVLSHILSGGVPGDVISLAYSPDGRTLAIGHKSDIVGHSEFEGDIRLWDAAAGELQDTLRGSISRPTSLAFSPDGRMLAIGHLDWSFSFGSWGWVSLRDTATREVKHVLPGLAGGVNDVAYSLDGRTLASGHSIDWYDGGEFGLARLWDVETGENIRTLDGHPDDVNSVAFNRDGGTLAIVSGSSRLSLWDAASGIRKGQVEGHTGAVSCVDFSPDSRTVASGSRDGSIHLWDAATGSHKHTLEGHAFSITSIAFSPTSPTLASGSSVHRYDSSEGGTVRLWDTGTGENIRTLEGQGYSITSVAFSPDGRTLAIGGGALHLYDAATGMRIRTPGGPNRPIIGVAFSPDGRMIAGAETEKIGLWNAETGAPKRTLTVTSGSLSPDSVAFSPDGGTLAAGGPYRIHVWNVETGAHTLTLERDRGGSDTFIAYSPDGVTIAGGAAYWSDNTVRLWDAETGENTRTLEGHSGIVTGVAFSPDGGTLASGSSDGTVLLWEIIPDVEEPVQVAADVNGDGVVDIRDLVLVAGRLGKSGENREDVNGDGIVNILDLVLVAGMLDNAAGAPLIDLGGTDMLRTTQINEWLEEARQLDLADPAIPRGIESLENLLEALTPERTRLLPNFPNPFNPETWIPYQLARDSHVRISIYSSKGVLVRRLDLGLQPEGFYTDKHYAAYWDGRNEGGELLASGVYIYVFRAGSYRSARRMAIVR